MSAGEKPSAAEQRASSLEDPLLDEVRAAKREVSERYGHDVRALCDQLRREQEAHPERLVRRRQG
jgi:hypothetical protein